jgi:hypothetical protein
MKFTHEFSEEAAKQYTDYCINSKNYEGFEIEAPEGFASIPVMEQVKAYHNLLDQETGERITRLSIVGKPINILLDNKKVGSFILNSLDDKFDIFPVFTEHPFALLVLIDVCVGDMVKKSLPPLKSTSQAEAKA